MRIMKVLLLVATYLEVAQSFCGLSDAGSSCASLTDKATCAAAANIRFEEKNCPISFTADDCRTTVNGASGMCYCGRNNNEYTCTLDVCFSSHQTVEVKDSEGVVSTKKMEDLKIGDNVRVGNDEFNKVFAFSHNDHDTISEMYKFETDHGEIELSGGHYIYANGISKPAKDVLPDEFLHHHNGTLLQIRKISKVQSKGLFAPHTKKGDIIVGGHRASCYTKSIKPEVAHTFLQPWAKLVDSGFERAGHFLTSVMQNEKVRRVATSLFGEK